MSDLQRYKSLKIRPEEKGLQFLTTRWQWRNGRDWERQAIPRSWCSHWESTVAECRTVRRCRDQRVWNGRA